MIQKLRMWYNAIKKNNNDIPRQREFIWPIWGNKDVMFLSEKDVTGTFAMWVVKQSPYSQPENIKECIADLGNAFNKTFTPCSFGFISISIEDLRLWLIKVFESIPSLEALNKSKLDSGLLFNSASRYHTMKPDYDFIDLHALARNISHTCGMEHFYWKD